jgi:pimeloyl-ACP methyl ester carboxylesterase
MGWPYCAVTLPNHGMSDVQDGAEYIVNAIRTMHQRTGRKIEYLGYSQGGMIGRWALRFWPDTRAMVDDYIGIDPSNHGTLDANGLCLVTCAPSIWQQQAGSHFLAALNSYEETFPGISYTVIYSNTDEIVVPNFGPKALSQLAGASNIAVQQICPLDVSEHIAMGTTDAVAYALFLDAITHDGAADKARIGPRICLHPLMPAVDPNQVLAKQAVVGLTAGEQVVGYPHTSREPALAPYVLGN